MVQRILLLLMIVFCSFSCNYSQIDNNQLEKQVFTINNNELDTILVTGGLWHILSEEKDNVVIKCNVCPVIEFLKKGMGKITMPSKKKMDFTYTLDIKKVELFFEVDQPYFYEKMYFYKIQTDDNFEIIELNSKNGKSKYILSREKQ